MPVREHINAANCDKQKHIWPFSGVLRPWDNKIALFLLCAAECNCL